MKRIIRAGLLIGLLSITATGHADDSSTAPKEMRPYVSELYTYTFNNDRRVGVKAGQGGQLSFGLPLSELWGVEVDAFDTEFPHDNKPNLDPTAPHRSRRELGAKADGLFFYSRNPTFSPYFSVGAGGSYTKSRGTDGDKSSPLADAGIGFISYFNVLGADLGFRADLRYRYTFFDHGSNGLTDEQLGEAVLKVGLVIPIGKKAIAAAPPAAAASTGCADSDGDGVCDTADLCPGTPKGTVVDAKGCPKIADEGGKKKFDDIHFAFDKSDLADTEQTKLDSDAQAIDGMSKKNPSLKVDVSGHTDWIGTDGYNQGLSERRANSVKSYLVRKGVDGGRISTFAFGESQPISSNETAEGRALNRRVEIQTHQ